MKFTLLQIILAVAGLTGAGFLVGRLTKPEVVTEKTKIEYVEKQIVVTQEKIRVEIGKVKDTQVVERWHREKTEETKPDGTITVKEVEDRNIDSIVREQQNSTEVKIVEVTKEVVVKELVETSKTPTLAQWRIGGVAGIHPRLLPPSVISYVYGAEIERRLIGPIWGGVWGQANTGGYGVIGIKASLEF